jgi:DNA gyrase subunit A
MQFWICDCKNLQDLERQKIEDELAEVLKLIAFLKDLLASEKKMLKVIRDELLEIKENIR